MKKLRLFVLTIFFGLPLFSQTIERSTLRYDPKSGETTLETTRQSNDELLKRLTVGFAAGIAQSLSGVYDYSLSPVDNSLKIQGLSRTAFVVSSVATIRLSSLKKKDGRLFRQNNFGVPDSEATTKQKFAVNIGLNLLAVSNDVQFNKAIDGGIGLGWFFAPNAQIALMFDVTSARRMREYLVETYRDKQIPKGSNAVFYTALDLSDNSLFYSRVTTGLSFKIVFSL